MFHRIAVACVQSVLLVWLFGCSPAAENPAIFQEDFEQGSLDFSRWEVTTDGDFAEAVVDVIDLDASEATDYGLRLRANTIGTSDPLKFLGVRSMNELDFSTGREVTFDLDWNDQSNGCYLTASLYICPTVSSNPKNESNWLKFEYTGVPPGRNVRINIWEKIDGVVKQLHTDWGPRDEQGRPIGKLLEPGKHRVKLLLGENFLQVLEDDKEIYKLSEHELNFTTAYIYLQMSSGTNYPSREVYFDNILVRSILPDTDHNRIPAHVVSIVGDCCSTRKGLHYSSASTSTAFCNRGLLLISGEGGTRSPAFLLCL